MSDLESVHAIASDPEVSLHSSWGPNQLEETRDWLLRAIAEQNVAPRMVYEFVVEFQSTGNLIGTASLTRKEPAFHGCDALIGYTLGKAHWNQGLGTEIAQSLIAFGFDLLDLKKIGATTSPLNLASQKVLTKSGMKHELLIKNQVLQRGQWRDSLLYGLNRPTKAL